MRGGHAGGVILVAMTHIWFKRWGWCYRPVHPLGYLATLAALAFCANTFVAIDRGSHSVADTLYHFYAYAAPTFLGLMWIASRTSDEARK
jgi:hypothetical protein